MPGIPQNGRLHLLFHARKSPKWAASPPILGGSGHEIKSVADHFGGIRAWIPERSNFFKGPKNPNGPLGPELPMGGCKGGSRTSEMSLGCPWHGPEGMLNSALVNNLARLGLTWSSWLVCQVGQVVFPKLVTDPDGHFPDLDARKPRRHKVVRTEILCRIVRPRNSQLSWRPFP